MQEAAALNVPLTVDVGIGDELEGGEGLGSWPTLLAPALLEPFPFRLKRRGLLGQRTCPDRDDGRAAPDDRDHREVLPRDRWREAPAPIRPVPRPTRAS